MRLKFKTLLCIASISFILNLVWENAQAPLYKGYSNFLQHLSICFIATFGDVLIILLVFGVFALIYQNFYWFIYTNVTQVIVLAIAGTFIAIIVEVFALHTGRWAYADSMQTIAGIGILPVLQMMIILPLTFYLVSRYYNKKYFYEQTKNRILHL